MLLEELAWAVPLNLPTVQVLLYMTVLDQVEMAIGAHRSLYAQKLYLH
jgi:hypothetical protein